MKAWQPYVAVNWLKGAGQNDLAFNGETVSNDTPYVVRLAQEVQLLPSGNAMLPKAYVLPGEKLSVAASSQTAKQVRIQPATVYGFSAPPFEAPLKP